MSDERDDYQVSKDNPAEHVDLMPADVVPSSPDALGTAVSALKANQLPATLADAMVSASDLDLDCDDTRFRKNRPQVGFHRLPWPLATRDPDHADQAIWWYAAGIAEGDDGTKLYLEGMRGENVRALARAMAFAPKRVRASDLVEPMTENEGHAGVAKGGKKSARGAGAKMPGSGEAIATELTVPDDCELVFRQMVEGEAIGSWSFTEVAKYVMLETWGLFSHPDYIKLKQQSQGWEESEAKGLYPEGGGLY